MFTNHCETDTLKSHDLSCDGSGDPSYSPRFVGCVERTTRTALWCVSRTLLSPTGIIVGRVFLTGDRNRLVKDFALAEFADTEHQATELLLGRNVVPRPPLDKAPS